MVVTITDIRKGHTLGQAMPKDHKLKYCTYRFQFAFVGGKLCTHTTITTKIPENENKERNSDLLHIVYW